MENMKVRSIVITVTFTKQSLIDKNPVVEWSLGALFGDYVNGLILCVGCGCGVSVARWGLGPLVIFNVGVLW